jgi:acetyl-CoA carboxylase biotin carboxyl carrier protein
MDLTTVKKLIKMVETSAIDELEIHDDKFQVRITKSGQAPVYLPASQPHPVSAVTPAFQAVHQEAPVHELKPSDGGSSSLVEICSPMVGTFYRASSPDAAPYAREGDSIQPGKVLCIVEAMKLMNEIEAEISGKIVKVLVDNAHPVEFNQPLFLVEKQ